MAFFRRVAGLGFALITLSLASIGLAMSQDPVINILPKPYEVTESGWGLKARCLPGPDRQFEIIAQSAESKAVGETVECNTRGLVVFVLDTRPTGEESKAEMPEAFNPIDRAKEVRLFVNGVPLGFPRNPRTGFPREFTESYIARGSGRTLIPIRHFSEGLGGKVDWNSDTRQVTLQLLGKSVTLTIDSTIAHVNGRTVVLDQAPVIRSSRTFVPLRFVMEAFGATVTYHDDKLKPVVEIDLPGAACRDFWYCYFFPSLDRELQRVGARQ